MDGEEPTEGDSAALWTQVASQVLAMVREFLAEAGGGTCPGGERLFQRFALLLQLAANGLKDLPLGELKPPAGWREQAEALWAAVEGHATGNAVPLRQDPRFDDPLWRDQPLVAMLHQTYLLFFEQLTGAAAALDGLDPARRARLQFVLRALAGALSPANFPLTNPHVLARARETGGASLIGGIARLLADLRRGQISHSPPDAFRLGLEIAATPGKVVHETPLYQLIQYSPASTRVLKAPLVIFPPWINRFYLLDLDSQNSFVRWAVEQGITTFMLSWKPADESMAGLSWDHYATAQIDAIDHVRKRLSVPRVHALGYCLGGTTLAATLAVLAGRGEADKVLSATYLAAQVDFSEPGDLAHFIGDATISAVDELSPDGYLDGRYLAAIFNLLRPGDLVWAHAERHYLLGEELSQSALLHWMDDVTSVPARWLTAWMRDLYRDNRLVDPGSLSLLETPIELGRIMTPGYVLAGREDHLAPPHSVWQAARHFGGATTFVLAGGGHAGSLVNPPAAKKRSYWTMPETARDFAGFAAGASETDGSWWPHWLEWLSAHDPFLVAVRGKRRPGCKGDTTIEDAPGRYVTMR